MRRWKRKSSATGEFNTSRGYSAAMRTRFIAACRMSPNCRRTRRLAASEKKGGRTKASIAQPGLIEAVAEKVADHTAGSPVDESLLWTNRSPQEIAEELAGDGFEVGPDIVRTILTDDLHLGLRQAVKDEATCKFPQRDEQFQHIARLRKTFRAEGCPVLSIDTKKKELLGNFHRPGRAYTDGRVHVLDHDFITHGDGRMTPYGVYDIDRNEGFMLLSNGPDTSQLACDAIWRWWQRLGKRRYAGAKRMLLLCDCGGSNGWNLVGARERRGWEMIQSAFLAGVGIGKRGAFRPEQWFCATLALGKDAHVLL